MNTTTFECFLSDTKKELKKHGINVILSKGSNLNFKEDHTRVCGFFDEANKVLAVATNRPVWDWGSTYIHEYCHFRQWIEKNPLWTECDKYRILWRWVAGEQIDFKLVKKEIIAIRNMELDCERSTVKLIISHKFDFDIPHYIKDAAAYIYYYNYMLETEHRKWFPSKNPPYGNKRILDAMPTTLRGNFKKLPKKILGLYKEIYI